MCLSEESSKNQRQEIQKQPADYQTNKGDDPTQEGVTLGTEYSTEHSNIIIKEEYLPDLNLDVYSLNQEKQTASYQMNKGDDPKQEGVALGTEYSTEYSNIMIKEECLTDLNLDVYSSNQEKQTASYQMNKGDDPKQEGVTLGTEYSTEYSNIMIKEECLTDLNLDVYSSNQEKQTASYQMNKGDDPKQEGVTLGTEYSTEYSNIMIKKECLPDLSLDVYSSNQEKQTTSYQMNKGDDPKQEGVTLGTEYLTEFSSIMIKEECLPDLKLELYSSNNSMSHLESKFKCPKCPNVYKSKQSLNGHLLKHEGIKKSHLKSKFKCSKCPNVYKSKRNLNEHLLKHESIKKNFPCDTCGKIFHSHVRMRVHMLMHRSNSLACEICRYRLSSKEALEKHHKTVHLHDYVCDICQKKIKCKKMLRAHIISHLESQFKCPKCPNVYKSKLYLNEHLLLKHEGIRKYECSICKERFGYRSHFAYHQKAHSRPSKTFTEREKKAI
ncbi:uncharacterized protein [Temnothorax longispinosus]|uniref:uncharacterized protein isoform X2 n=1 Tax=Temnothorax longispinosus TaxID=300112 RepID=UPI003A993FCF